MARLRSVLAQLGLPLATGPGVDERLARLCGMYEPSLAALARFLLMPLPTWLPQGGASDNWQATR
jgi:hypothetical protein